MPENGRDIVLAKAKSRDWCLCVFFSVDLEGATAYKVETRAQKGNEDWCAAFETFYEDFPEQFLGEYMSFDQSKATLGISDSVKPCLWKLVGDEILLYAPLRDSRQILEHIRSFGQAIVLYNKRLRDEHKTVQCKGTAWIGGFPVNNRIVIPQDLTVDFVGSSINCGFRLTKFSSPRRLTVSLDLLWMFMESLQCTAANQYDGIKFKYHGDHELKGVFSGKRYPVFWYDLSREGECVEDRWVLPTPNCEADHIIKFCEKIKGKTKYYDFIRPFIIDDPSGLFNAEPGLFEMFESLRQALPAYKEKGQKRLLDDGEKHDLTEPKEMPDNILSLPPLLDAIDDSVVVLGK